MPKRSCICPDESEGKWEQTSSDTAQMRTGAANAEIPTIDVGENSPERMGQILILIVFYSVCASAVLVGSTLLDERRMFCPPRAPGGIKCVAIPDHLLLTWAEQCPSLVIFDMHVDHGFSRWSESISYCLPIPPCELSSVLKWLPPASRVVLCCKDAAEQLAPQDKTILLQLGIGTVYFLSDSPLFEENYLGEADYTTRDPDREPGKVTVKAKRRCL